MKVALFNGYEVWGGGEKWYYEVAQKLLHLNHQVVFIGPKEGELYKRFEKLSPQFPALELKDFSITDKTYMNVFRQFCFWLMIKKIKADTFVFNSYRDVRAIGVPVGFSNIKKRILRVGTPLAPKNKWSYRLTAKLGFNVFVGISNDCTDVFKREAPSFIENKSIVKITNGINLNEFSPIKKEIQKPFIFGNCCRLVDQKGLDLFLKAIKKLVDEGYDVKGMIAGDGQLKDDLLALRETLGLTSKVDFIGHIENTGAFYPQIDMLLFTSYYEGTARTILEAFACAKPVIAFKSGSMAEMVSDNKDGFLATAFELDDLVRCCKEALNHQESLIAMGEAGRVKAENEYSNQVTYAQWVNVITS